MISHLSFGVSDLARSQRFYDAALKALGMVRLWDSPTGIGYGPAGGSDRFALFARPDDAVPPGPGFHLAFDAPTRDAVAQFHAAALAEGGYDDGPPGLRPHYGPDYFAAFVIDPDGYKLEAVCQRIGEA